MPIEPVLNMATGIRPRLRVFVDLPNPGLFALPNPVRRWAHRYEDRRDMPSFGRPHPTWTGRIEIG